MTAISHLRTPLPDAALEGTCPFCGAGNFEVNRLHRGSFKFVRDSVWFGPTYLSLSFLSEFLEDRETTHCAECTPSLDEPPAVVLPRSCPRLSPPMTATATDSPGFTQAWVIGNGPDLAN